MAVLENGLNEEEQMQKLLTAFSNYFAVLDTLHNTGLSK
jgi:hypothetical protein